MSDNWIVLIPEHPRYVPAKDRQERALARFREIAPEADEIKLIESEAVRFFDCGGNFERILCPVCQTEIQAEWWGDQMDDEQEQNYPLVNRPMPCCGAERTLHELTYEWPQGFGRFGIEAMNANIGELRDEYKREFEELLGCPLRVIYQHI